ncbi:hypothetical protein HKX48_008713 [Thoreauomyces humboldtii]|nr:hypothetical protein HKX48_008713 [Thoreauomyces humboldtii]
MTISPLSSPGAVVVVGAGIFGLTAAIALKERGRNVTVLDRLAFPAKDASSNDINRIVRMDYGSKSLEQDLAIEAIAQWRKWNLESQHCGLDTVSDSAPLFDECGILLTCKAPELGPYERACIQHLTAIGYGDSLSELSSEQLSDRFPAFADAAFVQHSAYFNSTGGMVNANKTLYFLRHLALKAGIKLITGGDAGSVDHLLTEGTKVVGAKTVDGTCHLGEVLVAAGAWSACLVPELASRVFASGQPVLYVRVPETKRADFSSRNFPVWTADITETGIFGFPEQDGVMKVACHSLGFLNPTDHWKGKEPISVPRTVVDSPFDTIPDTKLAEMKKFFDKLFPMLADAEIIDAKLCWYCNTFDERFLISAVPERPGLFVATGGSGHAFKFTPVLGHITADVVMGTDTETSRSFGWRANPLGEASFMPQGDGILAEQQFAHISRTSR